MAQAIVGLGNPGPEYRDTRHNVGQRVVEGLARTLHTRFTSDGGHRVARTRRGDEALYLVAPRCFMNASGPVVVRLMRRLGLGPADVIVVFDDLDLPLGTVRVRMRGSAGGHNGVRSLIDALGTTEFRRVKVGIGRPGAPGQDRDHVVDHVLSPFFRDELEVVEAVCAEAGAQALKLVAGRPGTPG